MLCFVGGRILYDSEDYCFQSDAVVIFQTKQKNSEEKRKRGIPEGIPLKDFTSLSSEIISKRDLISRIVAK